MCGRYTGFVDESRELLDIYTAAKSAYPDVNFNSGDIFPTNTVPLLTANGGSLSPIPAIWGFQGLRGKGVIINARAETAAEKYTFAESFRRRRCIVPTTGYYEWSRDKEKFLFNRPEQKILYLAGVYYEYADGIRFVILTTAANPTVSDVHHRMPLILTEDQLILWGCNVDFACAHLLSPMPPMVRERA